MFAVLVGKMDKDLSDAHCAFSLSHGHSGSPSLGLKAGCNWIVLVYPAWLHTGSVEETVFNILKWLFLLEFLSPATNWNHSEEVLHCPGSWRLLTRAHFRVCLHGVRWSLFNLGTGIVVCRPSDQSSRQMLKAEAQVQGCTVSRAARERRERLLTPTYVCMHNAYSHTFQLKNIFISLSKRKQWRC